MELIRLVDPEGASKGKLAPKPTLAQQLAPPSSPSLQAPFQSQTKRQQKVRTAKCFNKELKSNSSSYLASVEESNKIIKCKQCGTLGHVKRQCRKNLAKQ